MPKSGNSNQELDEKILYSQVPQPGIIAENILR